MLQHTLDRADQLSCKDQKVTVVSQTHHRQAWPHFEKQVAGQVILQPRNCNTGAGIFLAANLCAGMGPTRHRG